MPAVSPDVLKDLAPAGKLRAAINIGNSVLAQTDAATGQPKGLTPDLALELGRRPQNPLVGCLRIDRLLARPRLVFQTFKAMVGIAMPPKADNARLHPNFLGYRPGAAPGRRQQNYPRPLQIALQCHR